MQRLAELGGKIPVIASAGNTGRAFAELSARCKKPVVIVVPGSSVPALDDEPAEDIFLVAVPGDYSDAIAVSTMLAAVPGCVPEGGAKNVARRDGMGTVMLDAAVTTGRIPDHYFQAVGSGTGAIAAWEAAMRLIGDGRYGHGAPPAPSCPERAVHPHGLRMARPEAGDHPRDRYAGCVHAVQAGHVGRADQPQPALRYPRGALRCPVGDRGLMYSSPTRRVRTR